MAKSLSWSESSGKGNGGDGLLCWLVTHGSIRFLGARQISVKVTCATASHSSSCLDAKSRIPADEISPRVWLRHLHYWENVQPASLLLSVYVLPVVLSEEGWVMSPHIACLCTPEVLATLVLAILCDL